MFPAAKRVKVYVMTAKIWHMNKDKNHKNVYNGSVITGNDKSVIEHSLGAK